MLKVKEAYISLCQKHRTATGACMSYGIAQSYLPPGRGSTPALTSRCVEFRCERITAVVSMGPCTCSKFLVSTHVIIALVEQKL